MQRVIYEQALISEAACRGWNLQLDAYRVFRKLLLWSIAAIPCSPLKRGLYRLCFGYIIDSGTRLGFCLLDARTVIIGKNCRLHSFTMVRRVREFRLGDNVEIGPMNIITCSVEEDEYQYDFRVDDRTFITRGHRFDMSEAITIGSECTIGGVSGAFWTHGAWREHHPITIGNKCFVSDAAQILPGVVLRDNTLVAAAAVVLRGDYSADCLLLGNPATVVKTDFRWWQKTPETPPLNAPDSTTSA